MLTDDDLLRELEAGFRESTDSLTYTGRVPAPRPSLVAPLTAVPLAAAAVLVLPQLSSGGSPSASPSPSVSASPLAPTAPAPPTAPTAEPELVTSKIELAGMSFAYAHPADTPSTATHLYMGAKPSPDARPVDLTGAPDADWVLKAWVGKDPLVGQAGLYVQTKSEGIGEWGFFTADGVTADDWERMIQTGSNR